MRSWPLAARTRCAGHRRRGARFQSTATRTRARGGPSWRGASGAARPSPGRMPLGNPSWRHSSPNVSKAFWRPGCRFRMLRGPRVSLAGAMRSAPTRCEAGKRSQRFLAATSVPVIRVEPPHHRRICAPDRRHPRASDSRRGTDRVRAGTTFPARGAAPARETVGPHSCAPTVRGSSATSHPEIPRCRRTPVPALRYCSSS